MIAAVAENRSPFRSGGLATMMKNTEDRRDAGAYDRMLGPDINDYVRDRDLPMIFGNQPIGRITMRNVRPGFELVVVELIKLALRLERKRLKSAGLPMQFYYRRLMQIDEATIGESRIRARLDAKLRMGQ
jgi:hypothetical protein